MGAGGSKPSQVAAEPAGVHAEKSVTSTDFKKLQKEKHDIRISHEVPIPPYFDLKPLDD